MATYHLIEPLDMMLFNSRNWVTFENLNSWIDHAERADLNVKTVRRELMTLLQVHLIKPRINVQVNVVTFWVALHEEPFKTIMVKIRAILNRNQTNNNAIMNRSGNNVTSSSNVNNENDQSLAIYYHFENLREQMSEEMNMYDQNRFDTRFDWR